MIDCNGGQRNGAKAQIWGSKTTGIMMATVPHVTSGLGLRKFQADGFLLTRVYKRTDRHNEADGHFSQLCKRA